MEKDEEIAAAIRKTIEQETGQKVYHIRLLDHVKDGLRVHIILENAALEGLVTVHEIEGKIACRLQANYI
jgi:ADP-ribose pyrophosphatase YjhB (NUDIX family)